MTSAPIKAEAADCIRIAALLSATLLAIASFDFVLALRVLGA